MSFNQGLSGLNSSAKHLDVIGNNISNATTVGFKSSRTEFADVYAASLYGTSNLNVGIGSKTATVSQQFNQGNISATGNALDLAISGDGFFQLDQNGVITYTRNGQFQMDKNGYIVDSAGRKLTGNLANSTGTIIGGPAVPLQASLGVAPPNQTSLAHLTANLNYTSLPPAGAALGAVAPATAIDPATPTSYNYSTTITVYDSVGTAQGLALYFQKVDATNWNVAGYIGGTQVLPVDPSVAGATTATLTFGTNGKVIGINDGDGSNVAAFDAAVAAATGAGASAAQVQAVADTAVIVANAGSEVTPAQTAAAAAAQAAAEAAGASAAQVAAVVSTALAARPTLISTAIVNGMPSFGMDFAQLTQYGSSSGVSYVAQDGYSSGQFSSLSVDKTGLIQGLYTNGRSLNLGQVLLTSFLNPNGLQSLGDNQWAETSAAGKQNIGAPGTGVLGGLQSGAVEESNVDLTAELVNMIVAQRLYQANAQTVKTQDSILNTLVNMR